MDSAKTGSWQEGMSATLPDLLLKVIDQGTGRFFRAPEYAETRLRTYEEPEKSIQRMVNETAVLSATAGPATSFDGLFTLPMAAPGTIGSTRLHARTAAATAHLRGWFYLLAKYGTQRSALGKLVPVVDGQAGGTVDTSLTKLVAKLALRSFPAADTTVTL